MAKEGEVDYYKVLDIEDVTFTKEQITKQFKKQSLKYHPDKNRNDPNAGTKFEEVNN
jgi:DnaJ-class molecular chaperone